MITDKIINLNKYLKLPYEVSDFVNCFSSEIKTGKYEFGNGYYANVEEYTTKPIHVGKFESHKKYTDIQILLNGHENIYYTSIQNLNIFVPYDENNDITFYSDSVSDKPFVQLDGTNFAIFEPQDAHAPQIKSDFDGEKVLKVVIKVPI